MWHMIWWVCASDVAHHWHRAIIFRNQCQFIIVRPSRICNWNFIKMQVFLLMFFANGSSSISLLMMLPQLTQERYELEQLERLRIPPPPPPPPPPPSWLPIPLSHIGSQVKDDKVKVTNFKNSPKFYRWRYRADTILSTDGRTDRRTEWYQYTPLSTSLKRRV